MTNLLVIEEFYNDYDQHGGVLLGVYTHEPTVEDLKVYAYDKFGRSQKYDYGWVEKDKIAVNGPR